MSCFRLHFERQAHISIEYLCQGQYLKQGSRKVTVVNGALTKMWNWY